MSSPISAELRRFVIERAKGVCEYCGKPQISFFAHEIDHTIAEKHGGKTIAENLAFACFECNRYKGSDISSLDPETGTLTPLFNPRIDTWHEHFQYKTSLILPLTAIGRVTVMLLKLNEPSRLQERYLLGIGVTKGQK